MTITDDELKAMAVELCLLRGEQPNSVDRGGVERWERYKPLAEGALREAERLFALRQSSPPDGLDKDEQVAITEHLMMLADLDTEDAEHPPCTDFCGNRVCDQLGCVVWKYQRTHSIPTPSAETKAPDRSELSDLIERLRPSAVADTEVDGAVRALRGAGFAMLAGSLNEWLVENNALKSEAATALSEAKAENERLREALGFYADAAWTFTTNKHFGGLEWKPTEALLDDCGNTARAALNPKGGDNG